LVENSRVKLISDSQISAVFYTIYSIIRDNSTPKKQISTFYRGLDFVEMNKKAALENGGL
jgi:hypothetical protein